MLSEGKIIPNVTIESDAGGEVSLFNIEKQLIVFFYSKAGSPGCTKEALSFEQVYAEIKTLGWEVVGISPDSPEVLAAFRKKHGLTYHLLSDTEHRAGEAFGTWEEVTRCGKTAMSVIRSTFVTDDIGMITNVFKRVKTESHGQEVLDNIKK